MRFLVLLIRILSYGALALVGSATLILLVVEAFNLCPGFSANTGLSCRGGWYEGLANFAMGVVMMSLFSLAPAALAIAGLVFAVIDVRRWRRKPADA